MSELQGFSQVRWVFKHFPELDTKELYCIVQLRVEVFVVEQQCCFQDLDNKDQSGHHLMGWLDGALVAYSRLLPPGVSYPEPSIGRVVTAQAVRRTGLGKILMEKSIGFLHNKFGKLPIKIGAQCYLHRFYASLGFVPEGEMYLEDGIEHITMKLSV